jgi:hypothetical protein
VTMARYRIEENESTVSIEITETGGHQDQLLEAFCECQAGQCSCPTDEYQKLAAMDVQPAGDLIRLRLEAKPGEKFDTAEIATCLDYTTSRLAETPNEN